MVTTDTADIIAAIENELAANWYAHAAAERRAQRDSVRAAPPPDWRDFAIALGIWVAWGCIAVGVVWLLG